MVEGVRGAKRQSGMPHEGDGSASGGAGQVQLAEIREDFGHCLGPPAKVRAPTAPLRIFFRFVSV